MSVRITPEWVCDMTGIRKLKGFIESNLLENVAPTDWEKTTKSTVLRKSQDGEHVLCLFDQNLSWANGFTAEGPKSGAGLIQQLTELDESKNIICGLITHTITEIQNEIPRWREISEQYGIKLDRFLPLAKVRLHGDPEIFADGVKKTALNLFCEGIKMLGIDAISNAVNQSLDKIKGLDVYDFEYMVLRSSYDSDEWEANALIRLFQVFHKDEIWRTLNNPANASNFNALVRKARPIALISTIANKELNYQNISSIRHDELYIDESAIAFSPLELGDVFEFTGVDGNKKKYVLLTQPCDLTVRKNKDGNRNNPNLVVPLLAIQEAEKKYKKAIDEKATYWNTRGKLPYFTKGSSDVSIVSFAETLWISADILDLCVINANGNCEIDVLNEKGHVEYLTDPWISRVKALTTKYKTIQDDLEKQLKILEKLEEKADKENLIATIKLHYDLSNGKVKSSYKEGKFSFEVRRIMRYRDVNSVRLLRAYANYLARDADENDIAQPGLTGYAHVAIP